MRSTLANEARTPTRSRAIVAVAIGVIVVGAIAFRTSTVVAELENQVFTSTAHRLRLVVPRGWRATDQPTYPGLLLWMLRSQPEGKIVLTAEPFTRQVYCSWPPECRASPESLPAKLACALRTKLQIQRATVGPVQAGPRENEQAGMPSVWFEIDDDKRYVRQVVAVREDRLVSLVLSAPSPEARAAHVRSFEQALRSLRPLTDEELGIARPEAVARTQAAGDAAVASTAPADALAPADASVATTTFASAPTTKLDPVGPCAKK